MRVSLIALGIAAGGKSLDDPEQAAPDFLMKQLGHFSPAVLGLASSERVGHRGLLGGDKRRERLLDPGIERRLLI